MKNQFMALTMAAVMATQGILVNFAAAQTADAEICTLAGNLKARLGVEIQEEATRITEVEGLLAEANKAIKSDKFKDNIKDTWRIFAVLSAIAVWYATKDSSRAKGAVKDVAVSAAAGAVGKMEDVFDMNELIRIRDTLTAAVQRRKLEISMLNDSLTQMGSKDCQVQALETSTMLSGIVGRRVEALRVSIVNLENLKKLAPELDFFDKSLEYAKRPSLYGASISILVGGVALVMTSPYPWKSIFAGFVRLIGVLGIVSGGISAYTTHLEAQRAIKNKEIELETIQTELSTRLKQLEAVQSELSNLKKILG